MRSDGRTDIGKKRAQNQDSIFFCDEPVGPLPNLYIVADGMVNPRRVPLSGGILPKGGQPYGFLMG